MACSFKIYICICVWKYIYIDLYNNKRKMIAMMYEYVNEYIFIFIQIYILFNIVDV